MLFFSLRSVAVLSSLAQERRSREKNKNFRPNLLAVSLPSPNQNRHATQASSFWNQNM